VDELSQCINQLEAEIDDGASDRHACNGEAVSIENKTVVGCMKCQEDTNYEQVRCSLKTMHISDVIRRYTIGKC